MGEEHMKCRFCAALLIVACPIVALAQTADEIKNAEKTPQNVLTYGMSYSQQRFSTLSQINRDTGRGYIEAYDPNDGKRLWRHYTVPLPGEPGANTWPRRH